jgi:hypothetical protein
MFVVETNDAGLLRKSAVLMAVIFFFFGLGGFGGVLTMHAYVKPKPVREGVRLFGFRLRRRGGAIAAVAQRAAYRA